MNTYSSSLFHEVFGVRSLNYDEVLRRIVYWNNYWQDDSRRRSALHILVDLLDRYRDRLYFEPEGERKNPYDVDDLRKAIAK